MTYQVKQSEPFWRPRIVDLVIVTAMEDELKPVLEAIGRWQEFAIDKFPHYHADYRYCSVHLSIVACSLWKYGQTPTASAISRLRDLRPKLIVMPGICAGWERKNVQLGDIIVATRAFNADEGKLTDQGLQPDIDTFRPCAWMVKQLQSFEHDMSWRKQVKIRRPISIRYQAELLLCMMEQNPTPFFENKKIWKIIKKKKINGKRVFDWLRRKKYVSSAGKLTRCGKERFKEIRLCNSGKLEPIMDRRYPKVHYGPYASGQAVIASESKFIAHEQSIRSVTAIDMEVAALYQAVSEMDGVLTFAVKGVSDYGTPDKDDRFRRYAAEISVRWIISFLNSKWRNIFGSQGESDDRPLITKDVINTNPGSLILELSEWKAVHSDTQSLMNTLRLSLGFLRISRGEKIDVHDLEEAGVKWQLFVSQLESVLDRWCGQSAYTPEFDELRAQRSTFLDTTRILMGADSNQESGIKKVRARIDRLEETFWRILTAADKRIAFLIQVLSPMLIDNGA